jgi:protein ImuB
MSKSLFACIYAPEFPAQTAQRLRPELRGKPIVVLQGEPPQETVCSRNKLAHSLGINIEMTRLEAESFAGVTFIPRSLREEATTRAVVLECAAGFSPRIAHSSSDLACVCILDISGMERLFGPPEFLASKIRARILSVGISCVIAVSENYYAALSAARAGKGIVVIAGGQESSSLAPLPLGVLELSPQQKETFSIWGIRTLGELAALPEVDLISRMGQDGSRLRALARGVYSHFFQPLEIAFELKESYEFDQPVEILDSLLFVVSPMLDQLITRAQSRTLSLASVTIELRLQGNAFHKRTIQPALPTDNRKLLLKLMHLDLQAHPPSDSVTEIIITAETGDPSKVQLGLFSPQLPEADRLDVTLARISAVVGEDRVGSPVLKDTHQPDRFSISDFKVAEAKQSIKTIIQRPGIRRLRPEETIAMFIRHNRPAEFRFRSISYRIERAWGPWQMSSNWWNGEDWSIEQWDVVAASTNTNRIFCRVVNDKMHPEWRMAAFYD